MRTQEDWITSYLNLVDNTEPPNLFKAWAAVSTICAALQRKCYVQWGSWTTFYPNMYIVLCGPSGCRKGTAMAPVKGMLRDLGINLTAEAITREALIRYMSEAVQTRQTEDGMVALDSSLTIFSEELTVFLGQNNWLLMSDLNAFFDCPNDWEYRTKNMGTDTIKGVWLNLLGATTPDFLQSALPSDAIGGGLSSRIVFVYGDRKSKHCPFPFQTSEQKQLNEELVNDLRDIYAMSGEFQMSQDFLDAYEKWYMEQSKNLKFTDTNFLGYNERRPTHLIKMCMAFNASHTSSMVITSDDFRRALYLLEETEKFMPFVFSGRGRLPEAQIIDRIMRQLLQNVEITRTRLVQLFYKDLTMDDLDRILQTLEQSGAIKLSISGKEIKVTLSDQLRKQHEEIKMGSSGIEKQDMIAQQGNED